MYTEKDRYEFLVNRDGEAAALEFAQRTYVAYRRSTLRNGKRTLPKCAVGDRNFASLPEYRKAFIESYLFLKNKVLTSKSL